MASLNQLADDLKNRNLAPMSVQSLHEGFTDKSTAFLLRILNDLMEQRYQPAQRALENSPIKRVVIEDASAQVMPKSNAEIFPAHGNYHGSTAGVKIDFTYDLITGDIIAHSLEQATQQDKVIGKETLAEVKAGDLVLRDMGYFIIDEFSFIEGVGAWWLTRLPLTTDVELENGKPLEKLLKSAPSDVLDLQISVGHQLKKCRLVAVRADELTAKQRRTDRRRKARAKDYSAC